MDKYKILVVDDEPLIRSLLEKYLNTDPRFESDFKEDGSFIVKGPLEKDYDLVIFDVLMPNVNGIELLQNLIATNKGVKTLAITGMANEGLIRQIKDLGCPGILKKPIKRQAFLDEVYRVLEIAPGQVA
ncbi:MAG: response regulator [Oligoflexia bacterium]|nr:response regulator [Oligoflexia bacterium]